MALKEKLYCCSPLLDWIRAARYDFFIFVQKYYKKIFTVKKNITLNRNTNGCIHRWYYSDCYILYFVTVHWKMNIFSLKWHDTAKKIIETTELFFIFFFFAYFPSRFKVFIQKYFASCARVANEILQIYFSLFSYSKFYILFGHRSLYI